MSQGVSFIRVRGRIVPIKNKRTGQLRENKKLTYASRAVTLAGASIAGAGLGYGLKKFAGASAAAFGLEAAGLGLAFGAFSGKGRVKAGAKSELKNQALGWTTFGVSAAAFPKSRMAIINNFRRAASIVTRGKI